MYAYLDNHIRANVFTDWNVHRLTSKIINSADVHKLWDYNILVINFANNIIILYMIYFMHYLVCHEGVTNAVTVTDVYKGNGFKLLDRRLQPGLVISYFHIYSEY